MGLVLRVRVAQNPPRVWVKELGLELTGYPEDLLLFDAQCRWAEAQGVLPEDVALIVFRDASREP